MKRMMMVAFAACMAGGAMAVTTADYVQDGLVGHWDGIDNAGTGTHDPTATVWKDLTGLTGDLAIQTSVASFTGGNALKKNASGYMAKRSPRRTDIKTIEVVASGFPSGSVWTMLVFVSDGQNITLNDGVNSGFRTFFFDHSIHGLKTADKPSKATFSLVCAQDAADWRFYQNGTIPESTSYVNYWGDGGDYISLGARVNNGGGERGVTGYSIHSVRFYDRELSADEVLLNSAIDKVRLLGVRPVEATLPTGLRFDSDVNIVSNRAGAATLVWRGAAGGRWADAANWSLNGEDVDYAPMEQDTAVIASGAAPVVDAGQEIRVAAVVYADAAANPGTYTGSGSWGVEVPWLSGAGVVRIASSAAPATATWTGNGVDTKVTTPANWGAADNTVLPDLYGETLTAAFTAGGTALLDAPVTWKGISFASSGAFTFADAAKTLAIGSDGISTELAATPTVTHTFNVPIMLTATQTWFANTNATLEFTKPLSFLSGSDTLTLSGAGQWNFRATSTFPNDITATGDGMTLNGQARVRAYADNALGGPDGTFTMNLKHGALMFYGVTNSRPIVTTCNQNDKDAGMYIMGAGKTNVFNATFSHTANNIHLYLERGTTFIVNKKFTTASACYTYITGSGSARIRWIMNVPLYVSDRFTLNAAIDLDLNAPTNRINGNTGNIAGYINLNVPYALAHVNGSGAGTQFIPINGTLDMHGNDNGLGVIYTRTSDRTGTITSETPATMHLVDDYTIANYDSGQTDANGNKISAPGYTNRVVFTGCASLSKEGRYTNRLMKVSSTYGDLTVTKGRLEMDPGATWANASNLVVRGTGLFTLEEHPANAPAFGKHVVVRVEPGLDGSGENPQARIELLNATPQRCAEFYVDGVRQSEGWWGSAEAAAANPGMRIHTAPFFIGTGLLQVYSGCGLNIIFR